MSLPDPPDGADYLTLLKWHVGLGTRPPGDKLAGVPWTTKTLSEAVNLGDRTVRNWLLDVVPGISNHLSIKREFFGNSYGGSAWHKREAERFEQEYQRAESKKSARARGGRLRQANSSELGQSGPLAKLDEVVSAQESDPKQDEGQRVTNIQMRGPRIFLGRERELLHIQEVLERQDRNTQLSVAAVALHGIHGVGKSVLALAYAYRYLEKSRTAWWLDATSASQIAGSLVALGRRLGWLDGSPNEEAALARVMEGLRDTEDAVLLVFDNAADPHLIRPFLPAGRGTRIIITSNNYAWGEIAVPIEVVVWPKLVGATYLRQRAAEYVKTSSYRRSEYLAAEELSEALEGLPLAHEQAAAYCEHLGLSYTEYKRKFDELPDAMLDTSDFAPAEYYSRRTVAKTFRLALTELSEKGGRNYHPAAHDLILLASLLAAAPVPLFMFAVGSEAFGEELASHFSDAGLLEAVAALRAFALTSLQIVVDELNEENRTRCMRLHRLVRQIASSYDRNHTEERYVALFAALRASCPEGDAIDISAWPDTSVLAPHVLECCRKEQCGTASIRIALLHRVSSAFSAVRLVERAEEHTMLALVLAETLPEEEPGLLATSLNNLGELNYARGRYSEAQALLERAITISETDPCCDNATLATQCGNLGKIYERRGDLGAALRLVRRAVTLCGDMESSTSMNAAVHHADLARLLSEAGDLVEAFRLQTLATDMFKARLGGEHPLVADGLSELSQIVDQQGRPREALELAQSCLNIRKKVFGQDHANTARSIISVGALLFQLGDHENAKIWTAEGIQIYRKVLGDDHPDSLTALSNYSAILAEEEDYEAAFEVAERILIAQHSRYGDRHPGYADALMRAARACGPERESLALGFLRQALAVYQALEITNQASAACQDQLGTLLVRQGQYDEGLRYLINAIQTLEGILAPSHPDIMKCRNHLGTAYTKAGLFEAAYVAYEKALAESRAALGEHHTDTLVSLINLGEVAWELGKHAEARQLIVDAERIAANILPAQHPITGYIRQKLVDFVGPNAK